MPRDVVVLSAPYDAGHPALRMGTGPVNLLARGLIDRPQHAGYDVHVNTPPGEWRSELRTGFALRRAISAATVEALSSGAFPVLLSGNCNASLGVVAGLQSRGVDPGFVWCDAHADFHTPATDVFGSLDCQGLAMLTGRAWQGLLRLSGLRPLRDDVVALVGARSIDPAEQDALTASALRSCRSMCFATNPPDRPLCRRSSSMVSTV